MKEGELQIFEGTSNKNAASQPQPGQNVS